MKLRLHRPDRADDIAVIAAVRKSVGDKIDIIVDANQNHRSMAYDFWSLETALDMARELEELGVLFLEELLPVRNFEGLRKLAAAAKISRGYRYYRYQENRKLRQRPRKNHRPARLRPRQLLGELPRYAASGGNGRELIDESQQMILKDPVTLDNDGTVSPPDRPGIPVEIDDEVWARYAYIFAWHRRR